MTRSTRLLTVTLIVGAFNACNCDDQLHSFPGDLVGVICSVDSGQVMSGVPVSIVDADGEAIDATTDGTGLFRAEGLAAGNATLTVSSPDGEREIEVEIIAGEEARYDDEACHPPPPPPARLGTVSGCICDEAVGQWVNAANVYVITPSGSVHSSGTDDVGCFDLVDVPVGPQLVQIQKGAFFESHEVEVLENAAVLIATDAVCNPIVPPEGSGGVDGRVCASDGATWLAGATVYVQDAAGNRISQDETDSDGRYELVGVPPGAQVIHVEAGSFTSTIDVTVVEGQTTVIPDADCTLEAPDVNVAVVEGQWDVVEDVLARIGVDQSNITMYDGFGDWAGTLLEDYATLSQYDIIFLNCGVNDSGFRVASETFTNTVARDNLRQFVQEGGSVYASDWAYAMVERAWSDSIDFAGPDEDLGGSKLGAISTAINGSIADVQLAAAMGDADIELHYPLPSWVPMQAVAQGVTIYINGNAPLENGTTLTNVPHTVGFNAGAGRVIYTSFHQEPGISIAQERVLELLMFEL